jgi:hypothetical protein
LKKLAFIGSALGLGLGVLFVVHTSQAADHGDAPGTAANPMADINDVYTWMTSDGNKVNLVMTVSPADDGQRHFGPTIEYVFHVRSSVDFAHAGTSTETNVICKFADDTHAQCWVGANHYIAGNPSGAGITSGDGKIKLFAGRRSDPFFFNLQGFRDAVKAVDNAEGSNGSGLDILKDAAGCPNLGLATPGTPAAIRGLLQEGPQGSAAGAPCSQGSGSADRDCFINLNVMAIVLQVDKTLLTPGGPVVGVWGSTHTAP